MTKKKAKCKTAAKKPAQKKSAAKSKKEINPAEVRKEVSQLVGSEAKLMASAVIGEAKKGELAPMKYLFEFAGVYPPANDGEQATQEEDCLAKTLLDRLNAPRKPAQEKEKDEDDEPADAAADSGKDSAGGEEQRPEENTPVVLARS
jgi:hypothetical protein